MNNFEIDEFLRNLTALCNKYHVQLDSCGCCEGIHIYEVLKEEPLERYSCVVANEHAQRLNKGLVAYWIEPKKEGEE